MGEPLMSLRCRVVFCATVAIVLLGLGCEQKRSGADRRSRGTPKPVPADAGSGKTTAPTRQLLVVSASGEVLLEGSPLPGCTTATPEACELIVKDWSTRAGVDLTAAADARAEELLPLIAALGQAGLTVGLCVEVASDGSCRRRAVEVAPGIAIPDGAALLELREDGRVLFGGEALGICGRHAAGDCAAVGKALAAHIRAGEVVPVAAASALSWAAFLASLGAVPGNANVVFVVVKPAGPRPARAPATP